MQDKKIFSLFRLVTLGTTAMSLSACFNIPNPATMSAGDYENAFNYVPYALASPLRDLNITNAPIPDQLDTLVNPYGTDTHRSCAAILTEARTLNAALVENFPKNPGSRHDKYTHAGNLGNAMDATAKAITTSPIPFRGVVRFMSGAAYHDRDVLRADQKGRERLGFLIGVGAANRCPGFNLETKTLR